MKTVNSLAINPRVIEKLHRVKIWKLNQLLVLSKSELIYITNLSQDEATELYLCASKAVFDGKSTNAFSILNGTCGLKYQFHKIRIGCLEIDKLLDDGISYPCLTEICGESASGKTQLCLQLCLAVQIPKLNGKNCGGAVYISTEDAFPSKRLAQLIPYFEKKYETKGLADNIIVEHAVDLEDLIQLLSNKLPRILLHMNIKVVIIDSIAALFRVEFDLNQMIERSKSLLSVSSKIHTLGRKYHAAFICVNQVSDVIQATTTTSNLCSMKKIPALGLTWSSYVTVRLMIQRTEQQVKDENGSHVVRKFMVLFAPHLPQSSCFFTIKQNGLESMSL